MTYRGHVDLLQPLIVAIDLVGLRRWLSNVNAGYGFAYLRSRGHVSLDRDAIAAECLLGVCGARQLWATRLLQLGKIG